VTRSVVLWLLIAAVMSGACADAGTRAVVPATDTPSPTPSPTAAPTAGSYFVPVAGYQYVPLPAAMLDAMQKSFSANEASKQYIVDFAGTSVTRAGDPLGLTLVSFLLDPSFAAVAGVRQGLAQGVVGTAQSSTVALGGRPVTLWENANGKQYFWLHKNFMLLALAQDRAKAEPMLKALIEANSAESRFVVTGQVTSAATGQGIANVTVLIYYAGEVRCCVAAMPSLRTNEQGRFTFSGVAEGTYRLLANPLTVSGYGAIWSNGTPDFSRATDVVVSRNPSQIDFALPVGYDVVGTVRGPNGPLGEASVFVYNAAGPGADAFVASVRADTGGRFTLRLADGTYRILFDGPTGSAVASRWWRGATSFAAASDVSVRGSAPAPLDIALPGR